MTYTPYPYQEPASTPGNVPWPPDGFSWTGTGGITDFHSYAFVVHNAIYTRLSTSTFFAGYVAKRLTQTLPIESGFQIPFLGVIEGKEVMTSDGPINMGPIGFAHKTNFGIQVVVQDNDPDVCLARLDQAYWFIMNRLFRDDTFTNRIWTLMPDNFRLEGAFGVTKDKKLTSRNEIPVGILHLNIQLGFNSWFAPTEFANLDMITVKTVFPPDGTEAEHDAIQKITSVYAFAQPKEGGSNGKSPATGGPASGAGEAPAGEVEEDS